MKNTLISITAVILFIAVFSCFARSETLNGVQKKEIQLEKSIRVLNFSKYTYADTIANIGISTMKIKNVDVVIVPLSFKEESNPFLLGYIEHTDDYYIIRISSYLSKDEAILVISHELVHFLQFYYKRLIFTKESIIFDGVCYSPYMDYSQRPFEIEAFAKEEELKYEIKSRLNGK